jgi:hypothetical protein
LDPFTADRDRPMEGKEFQMEIDIHQSQTIGLPA